MDIETRNAAAVVVFGALAFLILVRWGSVSTVKGITSFGIK